MKWEPLVDAALPYLGPFAVVLSWLILVRAIIDLDMSNGYVAGIIFLLGLAEMAVHRLREAGVEDFVSPDVYKSADRF